MNFKQRVSSQFHTLRALLALLRLQGVREWQPGMFFFSLGSDDYTVLTELADVCWKRLSMLSLDDESLDG